MLNKLLYFEHEKFKYKKIRKKNNKLSKHGQLKREIQIEKKSCKKEVILKFPFVSSHRKVGRQLLPLSNALARLVLPSHTLNKAICGFVLIGNCGY